MRIINCLKAAVLAVLVGGSLWSCSGDKGKTRYVPVVLDGEEKAKDFSKLLENA